MKSEVSGLRKAEVFSPFSAEEIYIAKKCLLNRLSKPPNYDLPEIRGDDKSVVSQTIKNQQLDETF